MNSQLKKWLLHISFALLGALLGIAIYSIIAHLIYGRISFSDMISSAFYMSIAGLLLSGLVTKERNKHDT